jgi:hypothetical protein
VIIKGKLGDVSAAQQPPLARCLAPAHLHTCTSQCAALRQRAALNAQTGQALFAYTCCFCYGDLEISLVVNGGRGNVVPSKPPHLAGLLARRMVAVGTSSARGGGSASAYHYAGSQPTSSWLLILRHGGLGTSAPTGTAGGSSG